MHAWLEHIKRTEATDSQSKSRPKRAGEFYCYQMTYMYLKERRGRKPTVGWSMMIKSGLDSK